MGDPSTSSTTRPLSLDEYKRYGRQMIMPDWGLPGQLKVKAARVAVVGAGGLGCPVLQYLAGAGVGTIGVFDHDTVDISNLHRQVLHTTSRVDMNKADSAAIAMRELNSHISVIPHTEAITPSNALSLLEPYDIIVDCTDGPQTRYLLSDAAVLLDKVLVSGAAIASAGQWAIYGGQNTSGRKRACYRCMWPNIIGNGGGRCDELGVWGPVVGMVGVAMAGEVLKVILGKDEDQPLLHLFHQGGNPLVRSIKMRNPSIKCVACGPNATLRNLEEFDYDAFCAGNVASSGDQATGVERISVSDLAAALQDAKQKRIIVDTRPAVEYGICALPDTTNIAFQDIIFSPDLIPTADEVVFICRRGNDSLLAARALRVALDEAGKGGVVVKDVKGGLVAWSEDVDPKFPIY